VNPIADWLNSGKNYDIGVALYKAHGGDVDLKRMFDQGFSDYRVKRLEKELRIIKKSFIADKALSVAAVAVGIKAEPETIVVAVKQKVLPENAIKPEQDPYRDEWMPIYQQMNYLRHHLRSAETDELRGRMAFEILDLERQCMRIWYRRRYWLKYKEHLPEEYQVQQPTSDKNEMHRLLCNARANLSKAVSKLSKNPEDSKLIARTDKWKQAVKEIEEKLKDYA